jgi:hypothetical protein
MATEMSRMQRVALREKIGEIDALMERMARCVSGVAIGNPMLPVEVGGALLRAADFVAKAQDQLLKAASHLP